jgi:hypothetical protein
VGYSANPFTRVKNLLTGRGAETWEAEEGWAMRAEFQLQFFLVGGREWFYRRYCVCVKAHFHDSKSTFRIKDLFYVVARTNALPHRPDI